MIGQMYLDFEISLIQLAFWALLAKPPSIKGKLTKVDPTNFKKLMDTNKLLTTLIIKIRTADKQGLLQICKKIQKNFGLRNLTVNTQIERSHTYSILRSPHANKNSQEQFKRINYFTQIKGHAETTSRPAGQARIAAIQQITLLFPDSFLAVQIVKNPVVFKTSF